MDSGRTVMTKVTMKGKVSVFGASNALGMLGTIVLNVVHVVHEQREFS